MSLDSMIDAVRASEARLDDQRRAAILDRVLDDDAPAVATPLIGAPRHGHRWPRWVAVGAAGLALAAALALVILKLGADGDPAPPSASEARPPRAPAGVPLPPDDDDDPIIIPRRSPAPLSTPPAVNVPPTVLETYQLSGDKLIVPDDATKTEIKRAGRTRVIAVMKVCVGVTGHVSIAKVLRSTGYPAYDAMLLAGVRTWTYRPYLVDGVATEVCTALQFVYRQRG